MLASNIDLESNENRLYPTSKNHPYTYRTRLQHNFQLFQSATVPFANLT